MPRAGALEAMPCRGVSRGPRLPARPWRRRVAHVVEPVAHVAGRVVEDRRHLGVGERAPHLAGAAHDERARRHDHALGQQRPGRDDRVTAHDGAVEDDGAHADQHPVLDRAAMDERAVADGHLVTDVGRVRAPHHVHDGAVLDVGAGADADLVDVAAHHAVHPDARLRADHHIPDDLGALVHEDRRVELGPLAAERAKHELAIIRTGSGNRVPGTGHRYRRRPARASDGARGGGQSDRWERPSGPDGLDRWTPTAPRSRIGAAGSMRRAHPINPTHDCLTNITLTLGPPRTHHGKAWWSRSRVNRGPTARRRRNDSPRTPRCCPVRASKTCSAPSRAAPPPSASCPSRTPSAAPSTATTTSCSSTRCRSSATSNSGWSTA